MVPLIRQESHRERVNFSSSFSSLWLLCFGGWKTLVSALLICLINDMFGDLCSQSTLCIKLAGELVKSSALDPLHQNLRDWGSASEFVKSSLVSFNF